MSKQPPKAKRKQHEAADLPNRTKPVLLGVREAAEHLGVPPRTLRGAIARGESPAYRLTPGRTAKVHVGGRPPAMDRRASRAGCSPASRGRQSGVAGTPGHVAGGHLRRQDRI
jgi:excisionase family DNA binding protein